MAARKVAYCNVIIKWSVSQDGQHRIPVYCGAEVARRSLRSHHRRVHHEGAAR